MKRRRFLTGLGAGATLPLLGSLGSRSAFAAEPPSIPKRLLIFYTPNGTNPQTWFPTAGESPSDFALTPLHAALEPHKQDVIFLRGVDMLCTVKGPGEPHQRGMGAVLSGRHLQEGTMVGGDGTLAGWGDGITVDQAIANQIGNTTAKKTLEFGVRVLGSDVRHRMCYAGPAQPIPPQTNPHAAFGSLFAGLQVQPTQAAAIRARRKSVLDAAHAQFEWVRKRVSTADRIKLDQHRVMVRTLEKQLSADVELGGACAVPTEPPDYGDPQSEAVMAQVAKHQIDITVMALACDITRVATLQMSAGTNNIRFPFLNSYADDHVLSHAGPTDDTSIAEWAMRQAWYSSQFAYLLQSMKDIPEGAGNLLDNTVVLWCSELSQGNTHSHADMPFVLAGRAGGQLTPGRYLQFENRSHTDLLLSLMHLMDAPAETFGDPDFVTGPIQELLV